MMEQTLNLALNKPTLTVDAMLNTFRGPKGDPGDCGVIDPTLTQPGQAADAKTTGDALNSLNEEIAGVEPRVGDIPRIFYGASIPQNKEETVMEFRYVSKTLNFEGYCETKAQGNSSMSYPKKNQTTKLFKDLACNEKNKINFKGWGKQNKYCMKANWIDLTHSRNIVSALLWGDVVRSRAGYENLPELMRTSPNYGAIDGFPVRAFANGVYQGRYTINIPKDKWMANMDDENPNHCILCGENYVSGCFRAPALIDGSDWSDEIHDVVPDNIMTRWNQVINFVMTATDEDFVAGLDAYIDVDSAIDYYLFGLAVCNLDGFGKNQLYLTYDGIKWYASVYDMDSTFGLYYDARGFVSAEYDRTSYEDYVSGGATGEGNLLYNRLAELFVDRINARWEELRHGALSANNIINRFEAFVEITPPYIVAEDYAETTANGKFVNIPLQDTNNIQQIRTYVVDRLAYVNAYLLGEVAEVNLWNLAGRERKTVGVFVSPTAKLEIDRNAYYNGVNRAGYWQDAPHNLPDLVVNGDDFAVTTNQSGNSGYGIGVPIELTPGAMYRITCDVAGRGIMSLMYYDADGKYISRNDLNQATADGQNVDVVVTIPECDLVVVQAANNETYSEGATNLTTTYSNIRIVKQ